MGQLTIHPPPAFSLSGVPLTFARSALSLFSIQVTRQTGTPATETFRLYFHDKSDPAKPISPWHDIPLLSQQSPLSSPPRPSRSASRLYHYVNEIPRHSTAKMEVSTKTEHNPIAQDIKKGKLRHFTFGTIPFNYGCLPQTWEDPTVTHTETQCKGDNDPLDVVELSSSPLPSGAVCTVRLLGVFALIDEGETDWKLLAIRIDSPEAEGIRSIEDVERVWPGRLDDVKHWFKYYKTTDGKAENVIAYDERILGLKEAEAVVDETHGFWKKLMEGGDEKKGLWLRKGKVMGVEKKGS